MRHIASILLVFFFGFGPLAPLLEAGDARLPACCRGNGAHHCAMSAALVARMLRAEQRTPGFSAPRTCPLYRSFVDQAAAVEFALLAPPPAAPAAALALASSTRRIAPHSTPLATHSTRGPPALRA